MPGSWPPDRPTTAAEMLLYPRLPREEGLKLIGERRELGVADLRQLGLLTHPFAAPAPTGGTPAKPERLAIVQNEIRSAAAKAGFPNPLRRGEEQSFDRPCGTALFQAMGIVPADAASEDVWTFLTLVVVPEIGPWRFPERKDERLLGKPRNVLRRLWWRAWSVGPDLERSPEGCEPLGEDEFVGIMERSIIGGNPRTARAVTKAVWQLDARRTGLARSELSRELFRRFRAFLAHLSVDALSDSELDALLQEVADSAVAAVQDRRLKNQRQSVERKTRLPNES